MRRRLRLSLALVLLLAVGAVWIRRLPEATSIEVSLWPPRLEFHELTRVSRIGEAQQLSEPEVARLSEARRVWTIAQRTGVCALHQMKMQRRWLPVAYGLLFPEAWPTREEAAKFPYGTDQVEGGCVVGVTVEEELFRCPKCEQAYRAWTVVRDQRLAALYNKR